MRKWPCRSWDPRSKSWWTTSMESSPGLLTWTAWPWRAQKDGKEHLDVGKPNHEPLRIFLHFSLSISFPQKWWWHHPLYLPEKVDARITWDHNTKVPWVRAKLPKCRAGKPSWREGTRDQERRGEIQESNHIEDRPAGNSAGGKERGLELFTRWRVS